MQKIYFETVKKIIKKNYKIIFINTSEYSVFEKYRKKLRMISKI